MTQDASEESFGRYGIQATDNGIVFHFSSNTINYTMKTTLVDNLASVLKCHGHRRNQMNRYKFAFTAFAVCFFIASNSLWAVTAPRLSIIATTFPVYDWTRQVLGSQLENVELIQLQDNGVDLHNFQPTVRDMARISKCDLFMYVGGESDEWVEKTLRTSVNPRHLTLNMIKELGNAVQEEEPLEGMAEHHHHGKEEHHHGKGGHDDDDDDEHEIDEHIWLSLRCAAICVRAIAKRLGELDREHAAEYMANCQAYVAKLQALDARYKDVVAASPLKTLLFADRFPFRYMAKDYGLTCYAAFSGCSAETEASFKTIAFLAKKVDECNLSAVMVLETAK